jgi:hypothetical protein
MAMFERLFDAKSERLPGVLLPLAEAYAATGKYETAATTYARGLQLLQDRGEATEQQTKRLQELRASSATQ